MSKQGTNPFTVGMVLFDQAEELDWVGPFEVFTMARETSGESGPAAQLRVVLVSESGDGILGAKGLRNDVDASFADAPAFDVLLVPGGIGTRRASTCCSSRAASAPAASSRTR